MNIFVAKLNFETSEDQLRELFEEYGEVSSAKIIMDYETGKSKGFGFVEMPSDDEGYQAIDALNDVEFDGRTIVVKKARPKGEGGRDNRRGGYRDNNRRGGGYRDRNDYGGGRDNYRSRDNYRNDDYNS